MANNISHPRTDEFNVSYEQQVIHNLRFTASGIWRRGGNFVNNVISAAQWSPRTVVNGLTGQPFTAYAWTNQSASNTSFTVANPKGFNFVGADGSTIGTADPTRTYKALMLVLTNSLRTHFGYQFSYVLSKAEGTADNSGFGNYLSGTFWESPNTALINSFGELTNSRRHEVKAYFTYQIPKVDVMLGGNYTGTSGRPWTPTQQYSNSLLPVGGTSARRTIFLEPRGSQRTEFVNQVDLRVEKVFQVEANRFGVFMDTTNLFNANAVLSVQARYPSSGGITYTSPTSIQSARQVTFGARWMF
jgi:hypothetical protein